MLPSPLFVDIRAGAIERLPGLLAETYISTGGTVLIAVGPGQGEQIWSKLQPQLPWADRFTVTGASLKAASELQRALGTRAYDAVVAIGGGRTLDVAKYAATRAAVPMVAVATNLAHDGLCSPVASLDHREGKGSFGVAMPLAVVVDLDYVKAAPAQMVRAGIGDVVSNLSAIEDWRLSERERGESVDGLAVTFARTAANAILHRDDGIQDDDFLIALAESLVLSGMAMSVAGSSRPCSGACHEVIHSIDMLYPGVSNHGELAGIGAAFAYFLREDDERLSQVVTCLSRHGLPLTPTDIGLTEAEFVTAVLAAPTTRPDRYTILEHLALNEAQTTARVADFTKALGGGTMVA